MKEKSKIPRGKWKWKYNDSKSLRHSKNSSKREDYSDNRPTSRKKKNLKQPNFTTKGILKRREPKGGRGEEQNPKLIEERK